MEKKKKKLFQNCSAWFSSSVEEEKIKLWEKHGGTVDTLEHAQYVFSEDKEADDTISLFESEAYIDEHLAIFHANYITNCLKKGYISAVPVGKYHLVPKAIEEEMNDKTNCDALRNAYDHVQSSGDSIRKSAKMFGLAESTLRSRINNPGLFNSKVGRPTVFTKTEETQLAEHCKKMARLGYGYCRFQMMEIASRIADIKAVGFNPKKDWYYAFIRRFPDLSVQKPKKREISRVRGSSETNLRNYFTELSSILDKYGLKNKPNAIWNIDETGISLDHTPPKIVAPTGEKPFVVTAGKNGLTTAIVAGSALGETIPPYIIYKGQRLTHNITSGCLPGTKYIATENGWSNSDTFYDFVTNHFIPHVAVRPCLLLYDGHTTHVSIDLIEKAQKENIHMFVLPPHTSHQLQPLDVGIFSPFKRTLSAEIHKLCHSKVGRQVVREDLPYLIATAYESALTVSNLMSAFRKTGLVPFNPEVVLPVTLKELPKEQIKSREERKNVRNIKLLLTDIDKKTVDSLNDSQPRTRKYVIPASGTAITETEFLDKLKENSETKDNGNKRKGGKMKGSVEKSTKKSKVDGKSKNTPRKLSKIKGSVEKSTKKSKVDGKSKNTPRKLSKIKGSVEKSTKKSKVDGKSKNTLNCNVQKENIVVDSQEPGPSKSKSDGWMTFYNSDTDDNEEDDDVLCSICGFFAPPDFRKSTALELISWAKCDQCSGWVHLKYCTPLRSVAFGQSFICPKC